MLDDISQDETEVNMLSVIAHVIGFDLQGNGQPPLPAENARDADLLLMNWIASNTTDEDITWNFPTKDLFDLELLQRTDDGWEVIWSRPVDKKDDGADEKERVVVTVPRKGTFSIPPEGTGEDNGDDGDDDNDGDIEEAPPTIPLSDIVKDLEIPPKDDLAVRFRLKAIEFPQETLIPLWR